jgi:hypothetical protein
MFGFRPQAGMAFAASFSAKAKTLLRAREGG